MRSSLNRSASLSGARHQLAVIVVIVGTVLVSGSFTNELISGACGRCFLW